MLVLQEPWWSSRPQDLTYKIPQSLGREVELILGHSEHASLMDLGKGLALTLCSCDTVWKEAAFLRFSLVPGL